MKRSQQIDEFLNFIRECSEEYNIALEKEKDTNDETQDLLHQIELYEVDEDICVNLVAAMQVVRSHRRKAKDDKAQLQPIVDWMNQNYKVIRELEKLLGEVRKVERNQENRIYIPKTNILNEFLGEIHIHSEGEHWG